MLWVFTTFKIFFAPIRTDYFRKAKKRECSIIPWRSKPRRGDLYNQRRNYFKRNDLGVVNKARKIRQTASQPESDFPERNSVEVVAP